MRRREDHFPPPGKTWDRQQLGQRFRITKLGWYFIGISLALGAAALRTSNNLLFLVLGSLLGTLLLNGILESWNLAGLRIRRQPPNRGTQYVPFLMELELINEKRALSSYGIEVVDVTDKGPLDKRCYFLKVAPRENQVTSYRHAFVRRGNQVFLGSILSTSFPFGLIRRSRFVAARSQVRVHPHPRPVHLDEQGTADQWNARAFPLPARWGSPRGLREYRPGDDPSTIHHKASAHLGTLVVREMEDESSRRVLLLIDNALAPRENESYLTAAEAVEETVGRAAALVRRFIEQGFYVGLADRERRLDFGSGPTHLARALDFLALTPYSDESSPLVSPAGTFPGTAQFLLDRRGVQPLQGSQRQARLAP